MPIERPASSDLATFVVHQIGWFMNLTASGKPVTRAALLRGAREIFERDGFVDARIMDIAAASGVATGSFYTHFTGKDAVFAAVVEEAREQMFRPPPSDDSDGDPVAAIEAANRSYLEAYRHNAGVMRLLDQVAAVDGSFRAIRLDRTAAFHARNARSIRRLQQEDRVDPTLDPEIAAVALSAMVSRTAYIVYALGLEDRTVDELSKQLSRLWTNALSLRR